MKWFIRPGVLLLIFVCSLQSTAQSVGNIVRITTISEDRFDGLISEIHPNRIGLRMSDGSLQILPREDVAKLELNMGKRAYKLRGLLIGGGVGVAIGAVSAVSVDDCGKIIEFYCDPKDKLFAAVATTGLFGSIGMLAGAAIKKDKWQEVSGPWTGIRRLSPVIYASYSEQVGHRIQVGLKFRFS